MNKRELSTYVQNIDDKNCWLVKSSEWKGGWTGLWADVKTVSQIVNIKKTSCILYSKYFFIAIFIFFVADGIQHTL
jgi:hypothetical protein